MALVGDTCVSIGNADWFRGDSVSINPVAILPLNNVRSSLNNSVVVSGDTSYSEDIEDVLYYEWSITGPSGAEIPSIDDTVSSFSLDTAKIGLYTIELRVVAANGGCGNTDSMSIYCFRSSSPHHEATALDASYLWQLLPTAWNKVDKDTRLKIEIFWRGLVQSVGAELNSMFSFDVAKSLMNTGRYTASRLYKLNLVDPLGDANLYVWPLIQLDPDELLSGNNYAPLLSPPKFNLSGIITSLNSIIIKATETFQPSKVDIGNTLTIRYGNNIVSTRVSNIIELGNGAYSYILPSKIIDASYINSECSLEMIALYTNGPIPAVSADGLISTLSLPSSLNGSAAVIEGLPLSEGSNYTLLPYITLRDAWRKGIRQGDEIVVSIDDSSTGSSVEVALEVAGVLNRGSSDVIAFRPRNGQTFKGLLQDICNIMFSGITTAFAELSSYLNDVFIPRSTSNSFNTLSISIPIGGKLRVLSASLVSVYRKSVARIDKRIKDIGVLREFIELHEQDPSGNFVLTEALRAKFLGRRQISLIENSGFTCLPYNETVEGVNYRKGDSFFTVPQGSAALNLSIGDEIVLITPASAESYRVNKLLGNKIYTVTTPTEDVINADIRVRSNYQEGWVLMSSPLPEGDLGNLWAEAVSTELIQRLEDSYGAIVGLTHNEWIKLNTNSSYLDTVRAMYLGLVSGASIHNLEGIVSSILGSPYTPETIVVRDVILNSRTINGVTYAKLLCEVVNEHNEGVGLLSDFYLPTDAEHAVPGSLRLSTLGSNLSIQVGDIIQAGTCLSNIITVDDSVGDQGLGVNQFTIRLVSGVLPTSTYSLDLLQKYVSLVKPAHTDFTIKPIHYLSDEEKIDSEVLVKVKRLLYETPYGLHGPAEVLDDDIPGIGKTDTRPFVVLTTWFPKDGSIEQVGEGSYTLRTELGGMINPLTYYDLSIKKFVDSLEDYDSYRIKTKYDEGQWIRPGDAVVFKGVDDSPVLYITDVVDDNTLSLEHASSALDLGTVPFMVVRFLDDILLDQVIETTVNTPSINVIDLGARASNVSRGDLVCFDNDVDIERPIARMRGTVAVLESAGYPLVTQIGVSEGSRVIVRRPQLRPKRCGIFSATVESLGAESYIFSLTSHSSVGIAGINIGDLIDGLHQVTGFFYDRSKFAVRTLPSVAPNLAVEIEFTIFNPNGIEGHDALDLADFGVSTNSYFEVKFEEVFSKNDLMSHDGALIIQNTVMHDYIELLSPDNSYDKLPIGSMIKLIPIGTGYNSGTLPNFGDGAGIYRVLDSAGGSVSLNIDMRTIPNTVYRISMVIQNKLKSLMG